MPMTKTGFQELAEKSPGWENPQMPAAYHRTPDNIRIFTGFVPAARALPKPGIFVVSPGYAQDHRARSMQALAQALSGFGDVMFLDYRGTGSSAGFYSYGAKEPLDLSTVLRSLRMQYSRIHVLGFSLGAYIALRTAREFPGLCDKVFLVSCPASLEQVLRIPSAWLHPIRALFRKAHFILNPDRRRLIRAAWPFQKKPDLSQPQAGPVVPCHFLAGSRDTLVDVKLSRRVYEAVVGPKTWEVFENGLHAELLFLQDPGKFMAWLTMHLPPTAEAGTPARFPEP